MTHLVRHDHQLSVSQTARARILLVVLQAQNLLDVLDLLVLHDLIVLCLPDIEQFTTKRERAEIVSADDT